MVWRAAPEIAASSRQPGRHASSPPGRPGCSAYHFARRARCCTSPPIEYFEVAKSASSTGAALLAALRNLTATDQSRPDRPALCFSLVRDPLERFFSLYSELSDRADACARHPQPVPSSVLRALYSKLSRNPSWFASAQQCAKFAALVPSWTKLGQRRNASHRLPELARSIRAHGFWHDHLPPQVRFLSRNTSHCAGGIVHLGRVAEAASAMRRLFALARLDTAEEDPAVAAVVAGRRHATAHSPAETLRPSERAELERQVCALYGDDYAAFGFTRPAACGGAAATASPTPAALNCPSRVARFSFDLSA